MSTDINLYKINDMEEFKKNLEKNSYTPYYIQNREDDNETIFIDFTFTLYFFTNKLNSKIKWDWILKDFGLELDTYKSKPKAVLLIENGNERYAASFGYAYSIVGKFADKNWPLEFAERMEYSTVKSVGIVAPNSLINRKIYNYFNYDYLDVDSGEALNNIAVRLDLKEEVSKYLSEYAIIGNSIKFRIKKENLRTISYLVNFIVDIMKNKPKRNIAQLKRISDEVKIEKLNKKLIESIREDILNNKEKPSINISEFTIDGSHYVFFNNDFDDFGFKLNGKRGKTPNLDIHSIYDFIKKENLVNDDDLLDMRITMRQGEEIEESIFKKLIMYVGDEHIFNEGNWYEYNKFLVDEIHNALSDIQVCHDKNYDFLIKSDFEAKRDILKQETGSTKKCYFEYFFNNYVAHNIEGFECFDRQTSKIRNHKIEDTDLFDVNNHIMYAVKVGNSSGDLAYVIDQSLYALKLLDDNELTKFKKDDISTVGLWLIFKRGDNKFTIENNHLKWEEVNMLIFKSKIADWKRQVLLSGRKPVININYRYKDNE